MTRCLQGHAIPVSGESAKKIKRVATGRGFAVSRRLRASRAAGSQNILAQTVGGNVTSPEGGFFPDDGLASGPTIRLDRPSLQPCAGNFFRCRELNPKRGERFPLPTVEIDGVAAFFEDSGFSGGGENEQLSGLRFKKSAKVGAFEGRKSRAALSSPAAANPHLREKI